MNVRGATALAVLIACVATFLFLIAPDFAYAANPKVTVVDKNPAAAVTGNTIWTTGTSSYTIESKSNVSGPDDDGYYCLKKGKTSATIKIRYKNAAVKYGQQKIDYVVTLTWKSRDSGGPSAASRIFKPAGMLVLYATYSSSWSTVGTGAKVTVTVNAYEAGTTASVPGTFKMSFADLDTRDMTKNSYTSDYSESVELVGNYTNKEYIGKKKCSSGKQLTYGTRNNHPYFQANHQCSGAQDSKMALLASSGFKYILSGTKCTTNLGIDKTAIPKVSVHYNVNGGRIATTNGISGKAANGYYYNILSAIINQSKTVSDFAVSSTSVQLVDSYKNLLDAHSTAQVVKTGYHHDTTFQKYYYIPGNGDANKYFHANNAASTDANPVTSKRLNNGTEITADKTVTVYMNWVANTYTVKYDGNGASGGQTDSTTHTYDVAGSLRTNGYTRVGYAFSGWATSPARAAAGTIDYKNQQSVKNLTSTNGATVTLYAVWKPIIYNLAYELEGGEKGSAYPGQVMYDSLFTVAPPTRDGYQFDGWEITGMDTSSHLIGTTTSSATTFGPAKAQSYKNLRSTPGTVTFTASWTPVTKLILHVDDANSVWRTVEVENNSQAIDVPDAVTEAARKPNCHRLDGSQGLDAWYEDAGYTEGFSAKVLPPGEHHLYARNWSCITLAHGAESSPDVVYTGVATGVAGDIATASGTRAYLEIPYAESRNLPEPESKRVTYDGGFGFPSTLRAVTGWFTTAQLTGSPATRWTSSGDATLYKKWDASITDGALSGRG